MSSTSTADRRPDWSLFGRELRQRRESSEITRAVKVAGLDTTALDDAMNGGPVGPAVRDRLESAWRSALARPGNAELLAGYLYVRARHTWELSIEHVAAIGRTIDAATATWRRVGADLPQIDRLLALTALLKECMAVENAQQCSCAVDVQQTSALIARECRLLLDRPPPAPQGGDGGFADFVDDCLNVQYLLYSGFADIAGAMLAALRAPHGDPATRELLAQTIKDAREREDDPALRDEIGRGELRAYRYGLGAMLEYLSDDSIPRVECTEARFIYVYPFTFDGTPARRPGEIALRLWGDGRGTAPLARQRPLYAKVSELTDIWYWGHADHPSYGGITVALPPLSVTTTAGETIEDYQVTLHLNDLGNHYVRVVGPLGPLTPQQINQGLRRGSRYVGEEAVHSPDGPRWSRLRGYADEVVTTLAGLVGDSAVGDVDVDGHTHLEIRAALVRAPDGDRPATPDDLCRAIGPLLFTPVQSLASSLEEWLRHPMPEDRPDPLTGCAYADSLGARTDNTTTFYLPGVPNWAWLEFQDVVELAASVPALFRHWRHQVEARLEHVRAEIERHGTALERHRTPGEQPLEELRLSLGKFMTEVRIQRGKLHSGDLMESAVHRRLLDNLFTGADVRRMETELDAHIAELDALYGMLTSYLRSLQERATRRYQRFVELVLAGMALFSFAEFLGLINDLFFSGKKVQTHGITEIVLFLTLAGAVLGGIVFARRRT
ncbi:hypothetical protein DPM19_27010 [Actinomadura craniellae]|uniref:Uncharacterized protein n=1 Tax=Actinomadura craniellae TaxID=2231787 RepID=A0A365GYW2_9ACTN|nr:hypothetical protein [Actinomadura craniellae]RAY12001.1 hypothetical protein DPM19_27010 [Actinomadura craniellae]